MTKRGPIPFSVHERPAGTLGGHAWVIEMWPNAPGYYPVEFRRMEYAAAFILGLNKGKVIQEYVGR
jgi:hypothetical protein